MPGDAQPLLPPPQEGDPEDVAWALSTAEALWKRGEYDDAVAWVRRAANAASEAEADLRVVQLAKAAAELSAIVVAFGPPKAEGALVAPPVEVDLDLDPEESPAVAQVAPARPPGPPPRAPRLPTPNPVPSPLVSVPVDVVSSAAGVDEPLAPPPSSPRPPPSVDDVESLQRIPSVPPAPPDFAPTPMAMRAAPSVLPDPEPRVKRTSTHPFGVPMTASDATPSLAEAVVGVRPIDPTEPLDPDATLRENELVAAIEVPPKPGVRSPLPPRPAAPPRPSPPRPAAAAPARPAVAAPPRPASSPPPARKSIAPPPGPPSEPLELDGLPPSVAPPRPSRAPRLGTPLMGSVPPPRVSLAPTAAPKVVGDDGVQSRVSDAPPRMATASSTNIPAPPRAPSIVSVPHAPNVPALSAAPVSGRAVLLDPDRFEVLADVPDDAREALVHAAEKLALLPDETAPAPPMVIVLQGEIDVRARGFVTHLDTIGPEHVRLLAPFAPAEGELEVVASGKGARFLAIGLEAVEALRAAAPWVVQELEPASDDVHVVAGALRGRLGPRLDGGILDAILARAKTMRLGPGAKVVKEGEPVRALILVGAGVLEVRAGEAPDAPEIASVEPGEILFPGELLGRAPAPSTVRAGPNGALVIVATRGATEELLVTVPPLLELLGDE